MSPHILKLTVYIPNERWNISRIGKERRWWDYKDKCKEFTEETKPKQKLEINEMEKESQEIL